MSTEEITTKAPAKTLALPDDNAAPSNSGSLLSLSPILTVYKYPLTPDIIGPFRFLDLPSELRVAVYSYLVPYDCGIWFQLGAIIGPKREQEWQTRKASRQSIEYWRDPKPGHWIRGGEGYWPYNKNLPQATRHNFSQQIAQTSLFLVNKFISREARAVLYGTNTFMLRVDGEQHKPESFRSPLIFGALGEPDKIHLLRNLRKIQIEVVIHDRSSWTTKRHRARLEHFVNVIKQHADDENQKSLLKSLRIRVTTTMIMNQYLRAEDTDGAFHKWDPPREDPENADLFMFSLESLTALRGIEDVQIDGVPEWYAKCLEICIKSQGGDVVETDWPLVQVKRKRDSSSKAKSTWVTTRQWFQPTINWKEYAERNDIELPSNINKYWLTV